MYALVTLELRIHVLYCYFSVTSSPVLLPIRMLARNDGAEPIVRKGVRYRSCWNINSMVNMGIKTDYAE